MVPKLLHGNKSKQIVLGMHGWYFETDANNEAPEVTFSRIQQSLTCTVNRN